MKTLKLFSVFVVSAMLVFPAFAEKKKPDQVTSINPQVQFIGTDYYIKSLTVKPKDGGTRLKVGKFAWVSCTWRRKGTDPKVPFGVAFYKNGSPIGTAEGTIYPTPPITATIKYLWSVKKGITKFGCRLDTTDAVKETSEINNYKEVTARVFKLVVVKQQPSTELDLVVTKMTVKPVEAEADNYQLYAGRDVRVKCKWEHRGPPTGVKNWWLMLWVDGEIWKSANDLEDKGIIGGSIGGVRKFSTGKHTFRCVIDHPSIVDENNENNNERRSTYEFKIKPRKRMLKVKTDN